MDSLQAASKNIKTIFLLEFTKQLILNSREYEEKINEFVLKEKIKEIIKRRNEQSLEQNKIMPNTPVIKPQFSRINRRIVFKTLPRKMPRIVPFPATVRDIKPSAIPKELDLGKINPLIKDSTVSAIIIDGPQRNVQVRRGDEKRTTAIFLTIDEIKDIINLFAQESKIPIEDFYKVVLGNLMLSAIDPRGEAPKIIITKVMPTYSPRPIY